MSYIATKLGKGVIEHRTRWHGDTHADLGGSVDVAATNELMERGAREILRLRAWLAEMRDVQDLDADMIRIMARNALDGMPARSEQLPRD